jgi:peptidoglycan/xylan/chitin deacetylase (PgdA/CDA1 family)
MGTTKTAKTQKKQPNYKKTNRRGIIIAAVILFIVAGALVAWLAYRNHQRYVVKEETSRETSKFAKIDFDTTVEWNDQYRLHVMYPITDQPALDKAARAKIDTYVKVFRDQVSVKPKDAKPYELNILGSVNYASKTAINFVYTGKWSLGGSPSSITVNALFDRQSGKEIRTSDLFKDNKYLQAASDTARKQLPSILGEMNYNQKLVEAGTTPIAQHFDQFEIVDDKKINLIFEPGQVAAVTQGVIKVPLSLDGLDSDLNDDIVGELFPDYIAQLQAAAKKQAEEDAEKARKAAQGKAPQPLASNGNTDCSQVKCIALTFDDGPGPGTEVILDTLKKYNAHGTFMVVGSRVASHSALLQREVAEGHDVGNHTWDHADLTNLSAADAEAEVSRTADAVASVVGKRPFMVRPPYGSYNRTLLNEINLPFILWSVDPDDWKDRDADIVYQRVMAAVKPGAIVLSHDLYTTTAEAYQRIIPDLIQQGYTLVTVSDLLDLNPANPTVDVFSSRK